MIDVTNDFSSRIGTARNQGMRGTCLAFASSDFNRYNNSTDEPLSVEFLSHFAAKEIPNWKPGDGLQIAPVIKALGSPGQPKESAYPYREYYDSTPLIVPPEGLQPLYVSHCIHKTLPCAQLEKLLLADQAVCLIITLSSTFSKPIDGIVAFDTEFRSGLHAVLAVGIGTHKLTRETHILIRNSWGENWGSNGHAWLSIQYLEKYLFDSFTMETI